MVRSCSGGMLAMQEVFVKGFFRLAKAEVSQWRDERSGEKKGNEAEYGVQD